MFAANIIPFVIAAICVGGFVMVHDLVTVIFTFVLFDSLMHVQGVIAFILFSIAMFVFTRPFLHSCLAAAKTSVAY
jgi:hypothetical protein